MKGKEMKRFLVIAAFSLIGWGAKAQTPPTTVVQNPPIVGGSYTFDIPRVLQSILVYPTRAGGYILITSSAGESWSHWFPGGTNCGTTPNCAAVPPTVPFVLPFKKLASSFSVKYENGSFPTSYAVASITYLVRTATSATLQATNPQNVITGVIENVAPGTITIGVQASGVSVSVPSGFQPQLCLPVTLQDSNGQTLGVSTACFQTAF